MARRRSVRLRFAVPFAVAGVIALGAGLPSLSSAAAPPKLPDITLRQLIAKADSPTVAAFEGTLRWTAALGLPDTSELGGLGASSSNGFDWTSLTSGSHQLKVWSDGENLRLALMAASSEVDLYSNATSTWEYDSVDNTATHIVAPSSPERPPTAPDADAPTPQNVGRTILTSIDTWTAVSFAPAATIAGQAAYVVSLSPRPGAPGAQTTTLGRLTIAVDAANGAILRVAVYGVGSTTPALEVGFSSLTFLAPGAHLPASDFAFSPGPGVTVATTKSSGSAKGQSSGGSGVSGAQVEGTGWSQVLMVNAAASHLRSTGPAPHLRRRAGPGPLGARPRHHQSTSSSSALNAATTAVSGSWGSGRLLSTNLVNVLILPNGDVFAGFVTLPALEAAAASAG